MRALVVCGCEVRVHLRPHQMRFALHTQRPIITRHKRVWVEPQSLLAELALAVKAARNPGILAVKAHGGALQVVVKRGWRRGGDRRRVEGEARCSGAAVKRARCRRVHDHMGDGCGGICLGDV